MGQEIAYCAHCGCQLRGADFEKGGAFRVDIQSYCKKCAPEAVKSLPPEKIQAILKQGSAPKESSTGRTQNLSSAAEGRPATNRALRPAPSKHGPQQTLIFAAVAIALAGAGLLFYLSSSRPAPEPPQTRSNPVLVTP